MLLQIQVSAVLVSQVKINDQGPQSINAFFHYKQSDYTLNDSKTVHAIQGKVVRLNLGTHPLSPQSHISCSAFCLYAITCQGLFNSNNKTTIFIWKKEGRHLEMSPSLSYSNHTPCISFFLILLIHLPITMVLYSLNKHIWAHPRQMDRQGSR